MPDDHVADRITGLGMEADGLVVELRCPMCGRGFREYLPTIAGVAIGRHRCPACHELIEVWPEEAGHAVERFLPDQDLEQLNELTAEATRIVESWYRAEPIAAHLRHHGINLGQGAERELMSIVIDGLRQASATGVRGGDS